MVNTPRGQAGRRSREIPSTRAKGGYRLARAQGYVGTLFEEYCKWNAEGSTIIVQIEHIQAVKNLDAILSVEHIDGCIVGPYDLSSSLGVPVNLIILICWRHA